MDGRRLSTLMEQAAGRDLAGERYRARLSGKSISPVSVQGQLQLPEYSGSGLQNNSCRPNPNSWSLNLARNPPFAQHHSPLPKSL